MGYPSHVNYMGYMSVTWGIQLESIKTTLRPGLKTLWPFNIDSPVTLNHSTQESTKTKFNRGVYTEYPSARTYKDDPSARTYKDDPSARIYKDDPSARIYKDDPSVTTESTKTNPRSASTALRHSGNRLTKVDPTKTDRQQTYGY